MDRMAKAADGYPPYNIERTVDADGTEHVRFQRNYQGLPVIGGDFVVQSRNGKVGRCAFGAAPAANAASVVPVKPAAANRAGTPILASGKWSDR